MCGVRHQFIQKYNDPGLSVLPARPLQLGGISLSTNHKSDHCGNFTQVRKTLSHSLTLPPSKGGLSVQKHYQEHNTPIHKTKLISQYSSYIHKSSFHFKSLIHRTVYKFLNIFSEITPTPYIFILYM